MALHPLSGKPAPAELLIDVQKLVDEYYKRKPDLSKPPQLVRFGTSGHRGSALDGAFNEAHILAVTQAIGEYRYSKGIDGPLYVGKDTHALSGPAQRTVLEVMGANGVEIIFQKDDGYTPTPSISHAILTFNRGKTTGLADGIVVTPSHNPPRDGGIKYNSPNGGPADTDATGWIQDRANALLREGSDKIHRIPYEKALKLGSTHAQDLIIPHVQDLRTVIDMASIRSANLKLGVDPMGGASVGYWEPIHAMYGLNITVVNPKVDPTFRFLPVDHDGQIRMDCSSPYAMAGLVR